MPTIHSKPKGERNRLKASAIGYKLFRKEYLPQIIDEGYIDPKECKIYVKLYTKVLCRFYAKVFKKILEGKVVKMPYLGFLSLRKFKPKGPRLFDMNHYNRTGEKIEYINFHTDGYAIKGHWSYRSMGYSNILSRFRFKLTKNNRHEIAESMRADPHKHKEIQEYHLNTTI